jgi:hypothetical protein
MYRVQGGIDEGKVFSSNMQHEELVICQKSGLGINLRPIVINVRVSSLLTSIKD